jgi:hypothetical protein
VDIDRVQAGGMNRLADLRQEHEVIFGQAVPLVKETATLRPTGPNLFADDRADKGVDVLGLSGIDRKGVHAGAPERNRTIGLVNH